MLVAAPWEMAQAISNVAQGLGALGTVVAIYFLVRQTSALTEQTACLRRAEERNLKLTSASGYASIGALMLQIDALFADHPDLRGYAYGELGLPELGGKAYHRAELAAETIFDVLDVFSQQHEILGQSGSASWQRFARSIYRDSEVVRAFWATRSEWYPEELANVFSQAQRDLEHQQLETLTRDP